MRILPVLIALASTAAWAQPAEYFPLGASDAWTYGSLSYPPNAPPDTFRYPPVQVQGTTPVRDTLYTLVSFPAMLSDTLRLDAEGRIWGRADGRDQLLLDVTLPDSATYEVQGQGFEMPYTVHVQRGLTLDTPAGRFENSIGFSFDIPEYVDEELYIVLAPGVGIVRAASGFSLSDLMEATVDGTVILDDDEAPETATLRAFPTPFASSLTVELPRGDWQTLELVDAVGRRVATLPAHPCAASSCRLTWDATSVAPGVYVVRATGPSGTALQRVVRTR